MQKDEKVSMQGTERIGMPDVPWEHREGAATWKAEPTSALCRSGALQICEAAFLACCVKVQSTDALQ